MQHLLHFYIVSLLAAVFWDTEIWVFPIHLQDEKHWALATAYNGRTTLDVFNSLGVRRIEEKVENVRLNLYFRY